VNVPWASLTPRLERSRFARWQFWSLAAGGSRERHTMTQLYQAVQVDPLRNRAVCKNITLGSSREAPASRFSCVSGRVSSIPAVRFSTRKSGSPPGLGHAMLPRYLGRSIY
jgi:hypothetical protein